MFESLILWETSMETFYCFCLPIKIPSLFLFTGEMKRPLGVKLQVEILRKEWPVYYHLRPLAESGRKNYPPIPCPGQLAAGRYVPQSRCALA